MSGACLKFTCAFSKKSRISKFVVSTIKLSQKSIACHTEASHFIDASALMWRQMLNRPDAKCDFWSGWKKICFRQRNTFNASVNYRYWSKCRYWSICRYWSNCRYWTNASDTLLLYSHIIFHQFFYFSTARRQVEKTCLCGCCFVRSFFSNLYFSLFPVNSTSILIFHF